ncbi:MAG: class I SAM-dependent methyltransferase [Phycisphaera sp. TMED9]|nr:MAG: class I SAM-dependent methyltransferase [Phycisphaera sp. TMED9]
MDSEHRRANRSMWDERVDLHVKSDLYDVPGFLTGQCRLRDFEPGELGPVEGKTLLHLQCHFGLDSLSWARRGAIVTGIDFSEPAIRTARELAERTDLSATFEACDVYETSTRLDRRFDIVYTGLGAICWIPDLADWAREIVRLLKPGGIFYMPEFHPVTDIFGDENLVIAESYFDDGRPYCDESSGTYTDRAAETSANLSYSWTHPISRVITSLLEAGLTLESFVEHDYTVFPRFASLAAAPGTDVFRFPDGHPRLPLMYSIRMRSTSGDSGASRPHTPSE